jgi:hypothetical protein
MAVPNYTYLKLKIPGPKGIITVGPTYQRAYECDAECFQFAEAIIRSERLHAEPRSEDQDVPESSKPVLVKKKNKKWRMCVDYTSLNKACPKDPFPLPHID